MGFLSRGDQAGQPPRRTGDKYTDRALEAMVQELEAAGARGQESCILTIKMGPRGLSAGSSVPIHAKALEAEGYAIRNVQASDWGDAHLIVAPRQPARSHEQQTALVPVSVADELAKFAQLRDSGVITAEEFERQKAKLMG